MKITSLQRSVLKHICQKVVVEGYDQQNNIREFYSIMRDAALTERTEFRQDSAMSLDAFLTEAFEESKISNK